MSVISTKVNLKIASYFLMGMGFYLLALALGIIARVLFNVEYVLVDGQPVDVVTYIIIGAIQLIFEVIQILASAVVIALIWCYNAFLVNFFFELPIVDIIFGGAEEISEDIVLGLVNGIEIVKNMALSGMIEVFTFAPDFIAELEP